MRVDAKGGLKASALSPSETAPDGKLSISHALISDSTLSKVSITGASDITTQTITVTGQADISKDLYVGGTITVQGSVIGSGPYIDTSDARFKKNVVYIKDAMKIVAAMPGV